MKGSGSETDKLEAAPPCADSGNLRAGRRKMCVVWKKFPTLLLMDTGAVLEWAVADKNSKTSKFSLEYKMLEI